MTAPQIVIATVGEDDGYIIAVVPPEDGYHSGPRLVVGVVRNLSAYDQPAGEPRKEPEAWKGWLFRTAGGGAHVSDSCEAIEAKSSGQLRDKLQKRLGKGAWWQ